MRLLTSLQPAFIPVFKKLPTEQVELWTTHQQFARLLADSEIASQCLIELNQATTRDLAYTHAVRMLQQLAFLPENIPALPEVSYQAFKNLTGAFFYPRLGEISNILLLVEQLQPDVVLVHNDVEPLTRGLAMWARAHDKPCLHVPHAVYMDTPERTPMGTDVHDLVTATHIAAAGPYQAEWYMQRARAQNQPTEIRMTGYLPADRLADLKPFRADALRLLNLHDRAPVITYFSSWRQDTNLLGCTDSVEEGYHAFLTAAQARPQYQYLVKCHPRGQNVQAHVEQAKAAGVQCVVSDQHLDVFLNATDLTISLGPSNVVVEAACFPGMRLAAINGFMEDREVLTCTADAASIGAAMDTAFARPPYDNTAFVTKYFGPIDGRTAKRLSNWLLELGNISNAHHSS